MSEPHDSRADSLAHIHHVRDNIGVFVAEMLRLGNDRVVEGREHLVGEELPVALQELVVERRLRRAFGDRRLPGERANRALEVLELHDHELVDDVDERAEVDDNLPVNDQPNAAVGGDGEVVGAVSVCLELADPPRREGIARLTRTQSAFGAEYDSLSDMVSFGAAPALVVYEWSLRSMGKLGWIAAFIYVAGAALRLARFNTMLEVADKRYFQGLPSPSAAALVAGKTRIGIVIKLSFSDPFHVERDVDRDYIMDARQAMEYGMIDHVITKDSGGRLTEAKLDAARARGLPVIVVDRPPRPAVRTVASVDEALDWAHPG